MTVNVVDEFAFESAEAFLHALMPTAELWQDVRQSDVIFRGHADADWGLLPTALRNPEDRNGRQRLLELQALRGFWNEADRQGLNVPGDHREVRDWWLSPVAPGIFGKDMLRGAGRQEWAARLGSWPPQELWEGLALAQHYGIPTRLLDWTRLPFIAAYFAALGAVERLDQGSGGGSIAVWACHTSVLTLARWLEPHQQTLHLVSVARGGNPNLHAQHGVFTLATPGGTTGDLPDDDPVDCRPLESLVEEVATFCQEFASSNFFARCVVQAGVPLRKLTVPTYEAPQLLEFLDVMGVSGGTLFPGFGGAARGVNERALRERVPGRP